VNDALIRLILIVIAAITVVSGLIQVVFPSLVLGWIAVSAEALPAHLFATVGMFMVITGAMFWQSLVRRSPEPVIPFWIGAQKGLAALLVLRAVIAGLFLPIALGVALFDAATAVVAFIFWARLPR
jgi:hypothetical protein